MVAMTSSATEDKHVSYRLGIIGAGSIGRMHARSAAAIGVEVAAFCDSDPEARRLATDEHRRALTLETIEELLELDDVPAVVVATPNALHKPHAIAALRAGKDVLLEKPMALTAADCDDILAVQNETGRHVMLSFVCRCAPTTAIVRRFIESGKLGRIYHAKATWYRRRGIPGLGGWFTTKAQSGGGVLIDLGVHMIDLILELTGRPRVTRVSGTCSSTFGSPIDRYLFTDMYAGPPRPEGTFDVEDAATGLLRCDDGLVAELNTFWAGNLPDDVLPNGIILMGEQGGCYYDIWGDKLIVSAEEERTLVDITPQLLPGNQWDLGWQREHELFCETVLTRVPPAASAQHGRDVQAVLDAMYRSSAEGREVDVR
jgi:predicted dehydrogenase